AHRPPRHQRRRQPLPLRDGPPPAHATRTRARRGRRDALLHLPLARRFPGVPLAHGRPHGVLPTRRGGPAAHVPGHLLHPGLARARDPLRARLPQPPRRRDRGRSDRGRLMLARDRHPPPPPITIGNTTFEWGVRTYV